MLVSPKKFSLDPRNQPRAFINALCILTRRIGALLIFDEVITGFRTHPRGAQAWFGVDADLAVYGKVLGGGMPIGAVAGPARLIDRLDGGAWGKDARQQGPKGEMVYCAGTFGRHPVGMAMARACLERLEEEGPALQLAVTLRTAELANTVNQYFRSREIPFQVVCWGSLFRFVATGRASYLYPPFELDLFAYHLVHHGLYVWEGRSCFLSTAHTDEDLQKICEAVHRSIEAMVQGGFFASFAPGAFDAPGIVTSHELTEAQRMLWLASESNPRGGNLAYRVSAALRLRGPLDEGALRSALAATVAQNPSLRSRISEDGHRQIIRSAIFDHRMDKRWLTVATGDDIDRWIVDDADRPFDLRNGPLFRVSLLCITSTDHVMLLSAHHIIVDGWSMGVVLQQIASAYDAYRQGWYWQGPACKTFAEQAALQPSAQDSEPTPADEYWARLFGTQPNLERFPVDRRSATATVGDRVGYWVPEEMILGLKQYAKSHESTLFMLLYSAFCLLMHGWARRRSIVVGVPATTRSDSEVEQTVGHCTTLLPLISRWDGTAPLPDFLARAKEQISGAFAHRSFSFERLVNDLRAGSALDGELVEVTFNLDRRVRVDGFEELEVDFVEQVARYSPFLLSLNVTQVGNRLLVELDYQRERLDRSTVDGLGRAYRRLLQHIAQGDDFPLNWRLHDEDHAFLGPARAGPLVTIDDAVQTHAARRGETSALRTTDGNEVTYSQLDQRVDAYCRRLYAAGVAAQDRVMVLMPRSIDFVVAVLGIMRLGGAPIPVDPSYPHARIADIQHRSGAKLVATVPLVAESLPEDWTVVVGDAGAADPGGPLERHRPHPDEIAYVLFTSGSTGAPKGVMATHRGLANYLQWASEAYRASDGRGAPLFGPISFDATITSYMVPLYAGNTVTLIEGDAPDTWCRYLSSLPGHGLVKLTPAHLRLLHDVGQVTALGDIAETIVVGGEQLTTELLRRFAISPSVRVVNEYGPTEAVVGCCVKSMDEPATEVVGEDRTAIPIGRPIDNTHLYVLDELLRPQVPGGVGELYIAGAGLARGYLHAPGLTAQNFLPDPFSHVPGVRMYRTGDLVRRDERGDLVFLGRRDEQIKLRGHRIEPAEIQAALTSHTGVRTCFVTAVTRSDGDLALVAYLVAASAATGPSEAELRAWVSERVPAPLVPQYFEWIAELPLTAHGKVDRHQLPAPTARERPRRALPRNAIESELVNIWRGILRLDEVGVEDDFFHLGGHSLAVGRLVARVRSTWAVDLPVRSVFESPTIRLLAGLIDRRLSHHAGATSLSAPIPRTRPTEVIDGRIGRIAPASATQRQLWIADQLSSGATAYHVVGRARIFGYLDVDAFINAFGQLAQRHETLRTRFIKRGGAILQVISDEGNLPSLRFVDLSQTNSEIRQSQLPKRVDRLVRKPFDLSCGPLARSELIKVANDRFELLVAMHHIICDGWSLNIMTEDWLALYESQRTGAPSELEPMSVQFGDYIEWTDERRDGDDFRRKLERWKTRLRGAPVVWSRRRRAGTTPKGSGVASLTFAIDSHQVAAVQQLATTGEERTAFVVMLGLFAEVLQRYVDDPSIVVGSPFVGRQLPEAERLIAPLINTLPLRIDFDCTSLDHLIAQVAERVLEAHDLADVPLEAIVNALDARSEAGMPLFQVLFSLENLPSPELHASSIRVAMDTVDVPHSKLDLALIVRGGHDRYEARLEYDSAVMDDATAQAIAADYQTTFRRAAEPAVLSERLIFTDVFEAVADHAGDKIAVRVSGSPGDSMTFGDLDRHANRIAHLLLALGAGPEGVVAVLSRRSTDAVAAFLGILKAGATYLPLDVDYPERRLAMTVNDAECSIIITDGAPVPPAVAAGRTVIDLAQEREVIGAQSAERPRRAIHPEQLAYIIYTSGSTGCPNGVAVPHRGLVNLAETQRETFELTGNSRVLQFASWNFDASISELVVTLACGATLVLLPDGPKRLSSHLISVFDEEHITHVTLPPSVVAALPENALTTVSTLVVAGERCPISVVRAWARARTMVNAYGPSEATVCATMGTCAPDDEMVSIGREIRGVTVHVLDDSLRPVPRGATGELCISGVNLSRGYLGRPGLTAIRFVPDPFGPPGARMYRTGDLVCVLDDGALEFIERKDRQIKVRGQRVELAEIETTLESLFGVSEAVVVDVRDAADRVSLVGFIRPSAVDIDLDALGGEMAEILPDHMAPSRLVAKAELPLTPNGKVDRDALQRTLAEAEASRPVVKPTNPIERKLAQLFASVLNLKQVSADASFFDLGGDSISAIQVAEDAKSQGLALAPRLLFAHPTVRSLALFLSENTEDTPDLVPKDQAPITPIQQWFFRVHGAEGAVSHHFNLSVTLDVDAEVDVNRLCAAIHRVALHHETFQVRFREGETDWTMQRKPTASVPDVEVLASGEDAREAVRRLQSSLDPIDGPVFAALLVRDTEDGTRVFLTAHHLVVDTFSWQVFLRDVVDAYNNGPTVPLSPVTPTFVTWAHHRAHQSLPIVHEEELHWERLLDFDPDRLVQEGTDSSNSFGDLTSMQLHLDASTTNRLFDVASRLYRASGEETLVTAMGAALFETLGLKRLLVQMEHHGRDIEPTLKPARTIGWFTVLYPVSLEVRDEPLAEALRRVKINLRAIPNRGRNFMQWEQERHARLPSEARDLLLECCISFNYIGKVALLPIQKEKPLRLSPKQWDQEDFSPRLRRVQALDFVTAWTPRGLRIECWYSRKFFSTETITEIAFAMRNALIRLSEAKDVGETVHVTSDYPHARLNDRSLTKLLRSLRARSTKKGQQPCNFRTSKTSTN